ncbi:MAG: PilX N-terminal domain-containing pilus assembly protein [Pseudomonadales bacterium]
MVQPTFSKNRGVALFISLVLLLILTIIGVSAVQTSTLETRMARNEHDTLLAFQAAESALRDAENFLETVTTTAFFDDAGTAGMWTVAELDQPNRWETTNVWLGGTSVVAATSAGAAVSAAPRYLIEHVASVLREENAYQINDPYSATAADRVEIFRITARGVGGSASAEVVLQTTYGRILD